jgi:hypothetical protein
MGTVKKEDTHLLVSREHHAKLKVIAEHEGRSLKRQFARLIDEAYTRLKLPGKG